MRGPIVILAMPRSGSSMTAGIFAKHGVWVGPTRPGDHRNPKGYFEHQTTKKWLIQQTGHDLRVEHRLDATAFRQFTLAAIRREGYEGGPWLVKHSAAYWRAWEAFDAPTYVLVRRPKAANVDACIASGIHRGRYTRAELERSWDVHHGIMDRLRDEQGGTDVFTQDVVDGDYTSIQRAIEAAGLEYDRDVVDDFVDPEYWHHRKSA